MNGYLEKQFCCAGNVEDLKTLKKAFILKQLREGEKLGNS